MYTNDEIVKKFENAINDVSEFISKLNEHKNVFEFISNQTGDNCDPGLETSVCLERLGVLLAILNIYHKEYTDDPIDKHTGRLMNE
jgi:hypothetical protein